MASRYMPVLHSLIAGDGRRWSLVLRTLGKTDFVRRAEGRLPHASDDPGSCPWLADGLLGRGRNNHVCAAKRHDMD